jgi:hypothetical protein
MWVKYLRGYAAPPPLAVMISSQACLNLNSQGLRPKYTTINSCILIREF